LAKQPCRQKGLPPSDASICSLILSNNPICPQILTSKLENRANQLQSIEN
jgi:hypothetical protein